ncbi:MAG: hypothetical protein ACRC7N_16650, partial [Clostridium sp.]
MRIILKGVQLQLKNLFRNKMVALLGLISVYDFLLLRETLDTENYGLIGMRSYLITGLLLLLIYLGYSMAKEEEKSLCEEVILSINKGKENILLS